MVNKIVIILFALLVAVANGEVMAQQKKKSVSKVSKQYAKYVKDKAQGKEKLAQKRSSDPATVTREQDSIDVEQPQDPMRAAYEKFKQQAKTDYENFRDKANKEYAEFMKQAWKEFHAMPPVPQPVEKEIPPVVIKEEEKKPIESNPLPIDEEIVTLPAPEPQPVPVAPIKEQPVEEEESVSFSVYGTSLKVRFSSDERFRLPDCSEQTLSEAWKRLSGKAYNNTIRDCLELRIMRQFSDWAYLKMLDSFSKACMGHGNEAVLLMAYIYCQSGYRMRLGVLDGQLYMLYGSQHVVFNKAYYIFDDDYYYIYNSDILSLKVCNITFPKEKALSLYVPMEQLFDYAPSDVRHLKAKRYPNMDVTSQVNKNLIAFCDEYPKSSIWDNFMTRWAMLANKPMEKEVKDKVYPQLQTFIKDMSQLEAMERLLNWTQTSLVYEYDDKLWGCDRPFFAEESLFYPYADCEDRSILLSRLVRDLLGLKTILVYYPGHLAMAVEFTEPVSGDYIMLDGRKFVVCDPTFINANVGMTMTGMDNANAKVILLE